MPLQLPQRQREFLYKFFAAHCLDHQPNQPLRNLKSGGKSDTYIDVRVAAGHPHALEFICNAFRGGIPHDVWQIAGAAEGGLPPYGGVLVGLSENHRGCWVPKGIKVDKNTGEVLASSGKPYGSGKYVQGIILDGADAIMLEDTVTESGTVLDNVRVLKTVNVNVVGVLCAVLRDEAGGRQNLENAGLWVDYIFRLSEFVPKVAYEPPLLAA